MSDTLRIGQIVGDRWRIDRFLASGGFGHVFEATDVSSAAIGSVAVKVLLEGASTAERQAFLAEVRHMAALRHANLVAHIDSGLFEHQGQGAVFLVTELCAESLADFTARQPTLMVADAEVPNLVDGISAGLAHLHQSGRVHRDLKPANILRLGEAWKLADFGLVRDLSASGVYHLNTVAGTPRFMAPEFFDGGQVGPAADIWAVGVLLHEVLTGEGVHHGEGPAFVYQLTSAEPTISTALQPGPAELIHRCLATNPNDRPQASQLRAILDNRGPAQSVNASAAPQATNPATTRGNLESLIVGAPSPTDRPKRRFRVAIAVAAVASLCIFIGGGLLLARYLNDDGADTATSGSSDPSSNAIESAQAGESEDEVDPLGASTADEDSRETAVEQTEGIGTDTSVGGGEQGDVVPLNRLEVGQCVDPELRDGAFALEILRDCDAPHFFEVIGVFEHPDTGGEFPGEDALLQFARLECSQTFETRFGIADAKTRLNALPFIPTEENWNDDIFTVVCAVNQGDVQPLNEPLGDNITQFLWASGDPITLIELQLDSCFDVANELASSGLFAQRVILRDCDEPHDGESYWNVLLLDLETDASGLPDPAIVARESSSQCHEILHEDYGVDHNDLGFTSTAISPTGTEYAQGATLGACLVLFDEPIDQPLNSLSNE